MTASIYMSAFLPPKEPPLLYEGVQMCYRACVNNDVQAIEGLVRHYPGVVNTIELPVVDSGEKALGMDHPVALAIAKGSFEVAGFLLTHPRFEVPQLATAKDCRTDWPQRMLELLFDDTRILEKDAGAVRALPVFEALVGRGASLLRKDTGRGLAPLVALLWSGSRRGGFFFDIPAYLARAGMSCVSPLEGRVLREFETMVGHLVTFGGNDPVRLMEEKGKTVIPTRFDKVVPALADWLLESGWEDPVFLEWAKTAAPEVFAFRDRAGLEKVLDNPVGSSGSVRSPARL
jgi:hypothetical protein